MRRLGQCVFIAAVASLALVGPGAGSVGAREATGGGVTVTLPSGWHQRKPSAGVLSVYTSRWFIDENCTLKSDRATILLGVDGRPDALVRSGLTPIPRPKHFDESNGKMYTASESADLACDSRAQTIAFSDHGKTFVANLTFGRDAPRKRVAEAYRILDSLRVRR